MPRGVYTRNPELRPRTFRDCARCGKRFGPLDRLARKFCSQKCKVAAQRGGVSPLLGRRRPNLDRARVGNCLRCGQQYRAVHDHGIRRQVYCSRHCYLANRRVSLFEIAVFDYLESRGVSVDRAVRIGRWTFDGRIGGTSALIEADGDYWHSGDIAKERDGRKDAWCADRGFSLFRVPEGVFNRDREGACWPIIERWESLTGGKATRGAVD